MDSREAKEILSRYRPGDTNTADRRMIEALDLTRRDPALAEWFGRHCADHVQLPGETPAFTAMVPSTAIANRERQAQAAAAAAEAVAEREVPAARKHISPFNNPPFYIIITAMLIAIGAYIYTRFNSPAPNNYDDFRERMSKLVQRTYPIKLPATNTAKLRDYFRSNAGPNNYTVPHNLQKLPALGGASLLWNSQPVSLLGFDGGGHTNLYLFVISRGVFEGQPESTATIPAGLRYEHAGKLLTATWSDSTNVYLFTAPNDPALVQSCVE